MSLPLDGGEMQLDLFPEESLEFLPVVLEDVCWDEYIREDGSYFADVPNDPLFLCEDCCNGKSSDLDFVLPPSLTEVFTFPKEYFSTWLHRQEEEFAWHD